MRAILCKREDSRYLEERRSHKRPLELTVEAH